MITITKINGKGIFINDAMIESLESNPDTTITMMNGRIFIAKESVNEIIDKIVIYNRKIFSDKINS